MLFKKLSTGLTCNKTCDRLYLKSKQKFNKIINKKLLIKIMEKDTIINLVLGSIVLIAVSYLCINYMHWSDSLININYEANESTILH